MSKVGEHLKHKTYVERDETVLEHAVDAHWTEGQSLLSHLPKKEGQALSFVPELAGAAFVGHIMTDLDSVAGAIGAAHLWPAVTPRSRPRSTPKPSSRSRSGLAQGFEDRDGSADQRETCAWWISSSSRSSTR